MLAKNSRWVVVLSISLFIMIILRLSQPTDVHAAVNLQTTDNSCLTCHENLYYLHDTGCWYCMADAHKDRCVDCHEGNPAAYKEEESHVGMILHPQENNGEKCLECHTAEEAQIKLSEFESAAGFNTVTSEDAYAHSEFVKTDFPEVTASNPLETWFWLGGSFLAFGLWLALVLRTS